MARVSNFIKKQFTANDDFILNAVLYGGLAMATVVIICRPYM